MSQEAAEAQPTRVSPTPQHNARPGGGLSAVLSSRYRWPLVNLYPLKDGWKVVPCHIHGTRVRLCRGLQVSLRFRG